MTDVREVREDELERWIGVARAALDEADTVEGYLDWKRQARQTVWLLASDAGREVGTAIGVGGWHSPEGVARGEIRVIGAERGRGVGSALLGELSVWARRLGYAELMGPVKEVDAESLAWTERRGFVEVTDLGPGLAAERAHEAELGLDAVGPRIVMRRDLT